MTSDKVSYYNDKAYVICWDVNLMPSQTFFNLSEDKKKRLIDAAMKEFSSVELEKVSINKIVNEAKIPRGSFYMYFDSKYDLLSYLISLYHDYLLTIVKKSFQRNQGDIRNSFICIYDELIQRLEDNISKTLLKNIFQYMEQQNIFFEESGHSIFIEIKDLIEKNNIVEENIEFIFGILMHNVIASCTLKLKEPLIYDRGMYLKKLDIICYGIYQKEKK